MARRAVSVIASKSSTPTVNMPNTNMLISHRTLQ